MVSLPGCICIAKYLKWLLLPVQEVPVKGSEVTKSLGDFGGRITWITFAHIVQQKKSAV